MAFKYINYTETTPSSADATALTEITMDPVTILNYNLFRFKVGNSNPTKTTITFTAEGTSYSTNSYVTDEVYFSDDQIGGKGFSATLLDVQELDHTISVTLQPNEISPAIWIMFACTTDFYPGDIQFKILGAES